MAANNTYPPLPNPFTPLAFLPPFYAKQYEAIAYISSASLAVSALFSPE
jgi:hypothetical protein